MIGFGITDRVNYEIQLIEKHEELSAVYEQLAASEQELKISLMSSLNKAKASRKDQRYNLVVEASNIGIWGGMWKAIHISTQISGMRFLK